VSEIPFWGVSCMGVSRLIDFPMFCIHVRATNTQDLSGSMGEPGQVG
jgi:hypothetical protein